MAKIKVDRKGIQRRNEGETGGGPNMIEESIKTDRDRLDLGESYVCIGVLPGAELGQLYFNVQAEGPTRRREPQNADPAWRQRAVESCMESQNALMGGFTKWLRDEFLQKILAPEVEVDVSAVGWPCPFAKAPLQIEASMDHLEGIVRPIDEKQTEQVPREEHREEKQTEQVPREEHRESVVAVSETVPRQREP